MPRLKTAAVATLLVVPVVAGGFLLQRAPARASALLFEQVASIVANQYVDTLTPGQVYEKSAAGLVQELNDPYSELLSPKQADDFNRSTGGRYGGTGMLLGQPSPGVISVDRVFPNTPADEAGVREGDRVIDVDGKATQTLDLGQVSNLLRGDPGSLVSVTYARPGVAEPIKLRFTRRVVHVPAVEFTAMFGHVGYIPLQTFNENTADEVAASVDSLVKQGATSLVLDMRDNGGGIVDQALAVSSLFLPEGKDIVSVHYRSQPTEVARSQGHHLSLQVPLVVLLDENSASATEIVAGALQDHDRALIVGTTSFGKGLVQSVYPLDNGYNLKMTTGKWFTPSGRSIHRERKLLPDGEFVEVPPDSTKPSARPVFKSDGGRTVYGGGGIRPDVLVPDDTLTTPERTLLRNIAPKSQVVNNVLQDYATQLKGTVSRGFTPPPAWTDELMRRLNAAGVTVEPKLDSAARALLSDDLVHRVTRMAFGDAAAKARMLPEDHQLSRAIELLQHATTQPQLLTEAGSAESRRSSR
jgi:carboxyl-terminal processing protease